MTADLADIQGDILQAYGNDYCCTTYLFLQVNDADAARTWLRGIVDQVTTAERWEGDKPRTHINVAFTKDGLTAIGVPDGVLATFSDEFVAGMAARASDLGDVRHHGPEHWEAGLGVGTAHLLLVVNAITHDELADRLVELHLAESG